MLNPILASSALRRMRSVRTIVIIGVYVAVLMALLCLGMSTFIFGSTFDINSMSAGITTYCLLMAAQFALIVLVAPAMTAGSIAGERERQTLELLLVTNTGSLSIVFGKLMESFAFLALLIFSGLPVMCLTMLLGGTAGITEMLMQSHMGFIHLLPALPDAWEEGTVKGICAKGGFDVEITWKDGKLVEALITSKSGERCNLRYGDSTLSFGTKKGKIYKVVLKNGKLKKA